VVGVVENMSFLPCPHCGPEHRLEVFGSGGGARVAKTLSARFGYDVPVLGEIPLDLELREGGDSGKPIVDVAPDSVSATALTGVATKLSGRGRGLAGLRLGLTPTSRA
jgi:ATP-binding protein involved in chromosome partitioning